jgi:hypothetical protein
MIAPVVVMKRHKLFDNPSYGSASMPLTFSSRTITARPCLKYLRAYRVSSRGSINDTPNIGPGIAFNPERCAMRIHNDGSVAR